MIWITITISFIVLIVDQITKYFAELYLSPITPISVIQPVFDLVLVRNTGAAFGLMAGLNNPYRTIIFSVISIGAVLLLVHIYKSSSKNTAFMPISIGLVAGGAIGNWIDRIRFGHVIDFLDFHIGIHHWPTFNIADSCISIGVCLLLIQMIREDKEEHAS